MIKFWSYKREYKKYSNIFLKKIKKTLDKGTIFFGDQLNLFERNFLSCCSIYFPSVFSANHIWEDDY